MFFKKCKSKVVNISGMYGEEDVKKIENTLDNLIGVSKVKVNLKKGQAIVRYDGMLDEILLTEQIEKLGFTVTGIKELS